MAGGRNLEEDAEKKVEIRGMRERKGEGGRWVMIVKLEKKEDKKE